MAEAREKEPEVVLIGDTHIQRLAQHEVCEYLYYPPWSCHFVTFYSVLYIISSLYISSFSMWQN